MMSRMPNISDKRIIAFNTNTNAQCSCICLFVMNEPSLFPELNVYVFVLFSFFNVYLSLALMSNDENRLKLRATRAIGLSDRNHIGNHVYRALCIKYAFVDMCGRWSHIQ